MITQRLAFVALLVPALFLVSCNNKMNVKTMDLGENQAIAGMAESRLVVSTGVEYDSNGKRIGPARMVCSEPSPDVAKVFQESMTMASKLAASDASKTINGELAFEFSKAHAEAIAQLGERMATIQLLRDGLFRACEAFVNGGFNATMYAVMLSRFDDVMVTLMTSELAAGNFGRPLVSLGGSANASQTVDRSLNEAAQQVLKAEAGVKKAQAELDKATAAEKAAKKKKLEAAQKTRAEAIANVGKAATDELKRTQGVELAKVLHTIQRKYMENINSDALVVACLTELSNTKYQADNTSELFELCKGDTGILARVMKKQGELLELAISKKLIALEPEDIKKAKDDFKKVLEELKKPVNQPDS